MKQRRKPGVPVRKTWAQINSARAARMYRAGKTIPQIAEGFGDRLQQNKIRAALHALGLYEYQKGRAAKKSPRRK